MITRPFKRGQQLRKVFDGRIVTIREVRPSSIVLDGDFEPEHIVMKDKVHHYYSELPEETE